MIYESSPIFSSALIILFKALIDIGVNLVYSMMYLDFFSDNQLAKHNGYFLFSPLIWNVTLIKYIKVLCL